MAFLHNPQIITNGLVFYIDAINGKSWPKIGSTIIDLSPTQLSNTFSGTRFADNSLIFNGSTDFISSQPSAELRPAAVTVALWVKVNANTSTKSGGNTGDQFILFHQNSRTTAFEAYHIGYNEVTRRFFSGMTSSAGVQRYAIGDTINFNQWYYVVGTFNSTNVQLFIDGAFAATMNTGFAIDYSTTQPLTIGRANPTGSTFDGYFNGSIKSVKIYNRTLSADEIRQNYNAHFSNVTAIDSDARAFINAAALTTGSHIEAVNYLTTNLKSTGLWDKMRAIYPFVGGNATAHTFNLKDPRNLDAAFRLQFFGGWTHSTTGVLPNGTTGYANTFYKPSVNSILNNEHLSIYSTTNNVAIQNDAVDIGSFVSPTSASVLVIRGDTTKDRAIARLNSTSISTTNTDARGLFILTKIIPSFCTVYKNGSSFISGSSDGALPNNDVLIANTTVGSNIPYSIGYTNQNYAFASLGTGLTDADAVTMSNIINQYQRILGRAVYSLSNDTDVQAFISAAQITDSTQIIAIENLVFDLKNAGLWSKLKAIYPFIGGTVDSHKFNLKDPRDLDAAFRLQFFGGITHDANGVLPNGTNGYANTFLNLFNNIPSNNNSSCVYINNSTSGVNTMLEYGAEIVAFPFLPSFGFEARRVDNNLSGINSDWNTSKTVSAPNSNTAGFYIMNRLNQNLLNVFKNGSKLATNTETNVYNLPNLNLFLLARAVGSNPNGYSTRRQAFFSIGDGLTDTEAADLYNIVQAYQYRLNRAV